MNWTTEETRVLLASGAETGKLATLRSGGSPHLVPVWFVVYNGDVVFQMSNDSVKARNLAHDPRAALTFEVDSPHNCVAIEGTVTVSDDLDDMRFHAGEIGARCFGADQAQEFAHKNGVPGQIEGQQVPERSGLRV